MCRDRSFLQAETGSSSCPRGGSPVCTGEPENAFDPHDFTPLFPSAFLDRDSSQRLLVTVGLPNSGKSTWAKETMCPIVNPDSIRLALHGQRFVNEAEPMVWAIAEVMVRALFKAGHGCVVLDATNCTRKRRERWTGKEWNVLFVQFDVDKETCIERAQQANDEVIIPVIERMAAEYEPVEDGEGPRCWYSSGGRID